MRVEKVDVYGTGNLFIRLFKPCQKKTKKVVLICGGLGINSVFYQSFARWLASQGCCAVTFDHRGLGLNSVSKADMDRIDVDTWLSQDLSAILFWLRLNYPNVPLCCIGHSFGGATLGVSPAINLLDKIVLVSAQSGYMGGFGHRIKALLGMYVYILIPLLVPVFGYFPAKKIGAGENIPRRVICRWQQWVKTPGYIQADFELNREGYRRFRGVLTAISFSDDAMAPLSTVAEVADYYSEASHSSLLSISPEEVGLNEVGHFRMFSRDAAETIWPKILNSLTSAPEWLGGIRH
ncbi:alpha/beta fold hydrolase [Metapseudomonas lalkuanensis]|uniref:Alpha/beta fold hydrolase n=1 Tax=Metapseudomonas lalkuanensis TaxID=2604832 RepID=A0A5J6QPE5_9GAMM|nr:alpha/beta fold hydrolase [Pseudomonas lalkuanensis]QEY64177.1 alpha/beta fold hydrolase [Pseudomonas lalkuanensis]